jgi:predicted kinase
VSIEYLETTPSEQSRRNHSRPEVVPTEVIDEMIGKLVLPEYHEAHTVTWEIV